LLQIKNKINKKWYHRQQFTITENVFTGIKYQIQNTLAYFMH